MFLLAAGVVVDFVLRARGARGVVRLQYRWLSLADLLTVPPAVGVVMGVVSETMQPVSVGVWVREG